MLNQKGATVIPLLLSACRKNLPSVGFSDKLPKNRNSRKAGVPILAALRVAFISNEGGTLMVPHSNFSFLPGFSTD